MPAALSSLSSQCKPAALSNSILLSDFLLCCAEDSALAYDSDFSDPWHSVILGYRFATAFVYKLPHRWIGRGVPIA